MSDPKITILGSVTRDDPNERIDFSSLAGLEPEQIKAALERAEAERIAKREQETAALRQTFLTAPPNAKNTDRIERRRKRKASK